MRVVPTTSLALIVLVSHTPVAPRKVQLFRSVRARAALPIQTIHEGTEQVIILTPEHNEQFALSDH